MNGLVGEEDFVEKVSFRPVFAKLAARGWWIAACVALFTGAFTAAAFLMTPVYRASVVLAPAIADRGADVVGFGSSALGGLAAVAGLGLGPRDQETEEALAVLQSREFTERFIAARNLLPELFASKWDPKTGSWRVGADRQPTPAKGFRYFDRKVRSVVRDRKTGLVTLQIEWSDRTEAAEWANDLVHLLNEEMRSRAINKADASLRFLTKELQATTAVETRDAVSRLIESQVKQRMLADVTPDYSFRVVDKALISDKDDPVRPQKVVLVIAGVVAGLAVGTLLALLLGSPHQATSTAESGRPSR